MEYLWLCLSATAAGAINAIAGGGTLLTFPALLAVVSPVVANGTSTLALMPGSLASAFGFRKEMRACRRWAVLLTLPSLLGGAVGTLLVTMLPERYFTALIPWLILTAAVLFLFQPALSRFMKRHTAAGDPTGGTLVGIVVGQFFIAVYGGYFGAGIGILMLTSLSFLGLESIHQVNGLKTYLAMCINGTAAVLFVVSGNVHYPYALAMAAASIVGGYVGARLSLRLRPAAVRWLVIAIGFGLAVYEFQRHPTPTPAAETRPDAAIP
jgi:uncharacterized membrane protein YfcA